MLKSKLLPQKEDEIRSKETINLSKWALDYQINQDKVIWLRSWSSSGPYKTMSRTNFARFSSVPILVSILLQEVLDSSEDKSNSMLNYSSVWFVTVQKWIHLFNLIHLLHMYNKQKSREWCHVTSSIGCSKKRVPSRFLTHRKTGSRSFSSI